MYNTCAIISRYMVTPYYIIEDNKGLVRLDLFQVISSNAPLRSLRSAMNNNRSGLEIWQDLLRIQLHLIDSITIRWPRNAV